jgi:hypothetical protein
MGTDCCGGSCGSNIPRNFMTKEEKIEMLQEYGNSLEKEMKAVKERINDLKKKE